MVMARILVQVEVTPEQKKRLQRIAEARDATTSEIVRALIEDTPIRPTHATTGNVRSRVKA